MEPAERANKRNLWGPLWPLGEALRFLTIIPLPGMPPMAEQSIARAIPLFPLAGTVIGALLVGLGLACGVLWYAWVRAVVIVVGWGIVTAGLHLDGLSDTFDAVMSWRTRERKLEIMKDSRIGAMGALAHELGHAVALLKHYDGWTAEQQAEFSMWGTVMFNWWSWQENAPESITAPGFAPFEKEALLASPIFH